MTIRKKGIQPVDARSLFEVMTEDFYYGCVVELAVASDAVPARYSVRTSRRRWTASLPSRPPRAPGRPPETRRDPPGGR